MGILFLNHLVNFEYINKVYFTKLPRENLSWKIWVTSNSNSCIGADKCAAVTNPTGLNLSPTLNEWPGLAIENSDISKVVDPIPTVVFAALTFTSTNKLEPVSVVAPIPCLDIPITGKLS